MGTRVHYQEERKWETIILKQSGLTNKEIMEQLGIKNKNQIKTWIKMVQSWRDLSIFPKSRQAIVKD
jgi:hypothetical protein